MDELGVSSTLKRRAGFCPILWAGPLKQLTIGVAVDAIVRRRGSADKGARDATRYRTDGGSAPAPGYGTDAGSGRCAQSAATDGAIRL
jgi:hypothetical protein